MGVILTLNAGSSSIKFGVFGLDLDERASGQVERIGGAAEIDVKVAGQKTERRIEAQDHTAAVQAILATLDDLLDGVPVVGVGHRVVHGGTQFKDHSPLDDQVVADLESLRSLAPLHQPHNVAAIKAARAAFPQATQVACFDTAFHQGKPFVHDTYGLPRRYYEAGIRRYGFHGLSYTYIRSALMAEDEATAKGRVIIAHLGNGASLAAMKDGQPIATSMGMSALDGLAMGTRPGQIDPGVLLYLMDQEGMGYDDLTQLLYKDSGLKGLSGLSNDMRELLASDAPEAAEAVAYFVARLQREIASATAALGGLDTLVFTGGIGENAAPIRARVMGGLGFLGLQLDEAANTAGAGTISTPASTATARVIATNEELVIARAVAAAL